MHTVVALIRLLGNAGAVANARALAEERAAEEWTVADLAARVETVTGSRPVSGRPASAA